MKSKRFGRAARCLSVLAWSLCLACAAYASATPGPKTSRPVSPPDVSGASAGQQIIPAAPQVDAHADILIDYTTGEVLAHHNASERLPMASLTKLMTAYIVFHALADGSLKTSDLVTISKKAWRTGGSRTFVKLGSQVPVVDLIKGMLVQSGNDATVALAQRVAGTQAAFVQLMNAYAQRLGLHQTHYEDVTGLPVAMHYTTARDLATLTAAIIRTFPQYYHWFALKQFTWNHIKQDNRNGLLWTDPSVDGLKTGDTDAAGYCLVASAKRGATRLISVVLGSSSFKGREVASEALLNWGFNFYQTVNVQKSGVAVLEPRVYEGASQYVPVGVADDVVLTLPRGKLAEIRTRASVDAPLKAPLTVHTPVGRFSVSAGGQLLASVPLFPLKPVPEGGWWTRMSDSIRLFLQQHRL